MKKIQYGGGKNPPLCRMEEDMEQRNTMERRITEEMIEEYRNYLYEEEKSRATIEKYLCDLKKLIGYANGRH